MSQVDAPPKTFISSGRSYDPLAAVLSYLVPGLGQIYQGRVGKGLLFLVSLLGLFFYGMWLGSWSNVFIPDTAAKSNSWKLPTSMANVVNRLPYAGQFWIGVAAWPAIYQYNHPSDPNVVLPEEQLNSFWHNFQRTPPESTSEVVKGYKGKTLQELQTDGDKTWDLGWVYTVIAGVLNILVIYDAFAGPAFRPEEEPATPAPKEEVVPV